MDTITLSMYWVFIRFFDWVIMFKYKYSQLNKKAKQKACKDYYKDAQKWLKKEYTWQECEQFCLDTENECFYDVKGNLINYDNEDKFL